MKYLEAKKIKENNLHIVGLLHNGSVIDELVIHPIKPEDFNEFITEYLDSFNSEEAISKFKDKDLTVSVVFEKENTWGNGIFFKTSLHNLKNENLNIKL